MIVRIEDLELGMKVKLVDRMPFSVLFHPFMGEYLGRVCTIKSIGITNNYFEIEEDQEEFYNGGFHWDIKFIKKIIGDKEKQNEVYTELNEIKIRSSMKNYIKLELTRLRDDELNFKKCIVNNNCVVGIFSASGRIYKGVAKCHPDDKFDLAKGLTIAMLRAYKDCFDTRLRDNKKLIEKMIEEYGNEI